MRLATALAVFLLTFPLMASAPLVGIDNNQVAVQSNSTLTTSGSSVFPGFNNREVDLYVNIKASPTGTTPTLTYTIQEVDPGDRTTVIGQSVSTTALNATGTTGPLSLYTTGSSYIKVTWTITGTTPSFTQVYATLRAKADPNPGTSTSSATLNAQCLDANINACGAGSFISIDTSGQFEAWFKLPASHNISGGVAKPDCSSDGLTWSSTYFDDSTGKLASKTLVSGTLYDSSVIPCGGQKYSRVRLSAWTSGSGAATMSASLAKDPSLLATGVPGGAVQPPAGIQDCGWNGSTFECLNVEKITHAVRAVHYPINVGTLGSYAACGITGTMAAALAANSPVFAYRWGDASNLALVRKISVAMQSLGTAFTAGNGVFKLIGARAFTASDTGGGAVTLTTNNGKRKTSFGTTLTTQMQVATTATLTAGTRTLDATPLAVVSYGVPTTANNTDLPTTNLWAPDFGGEWPMVLAQNEGFEIQATVPATGTWQGVFCMEWTEVPGTTWP